MSDEASNGIQTMLMVNTVPLECINNAAIQYHIPAIVILAVLKTEGGYNGLAKLNRNKSWDYGSMQINSNFLSPMTIQGYTRDDMRYNSCANITVGAWLLSQHIANSKVFQKGIGNYHSITLQLNTKYFKEVRRNYKLIIQNVYYH